VVIAWTEGTKSRLDVCVPVDFTTNPEISVDTRLEKIKNSHIVIAGTLEQIVARLERRVGIPLRAMSAARSNASKLMTCSHR
jgi:hypothetical protein